jgi:hypothetical protein
MTSLFPALPIGSALLCLVVGCGTRSEYLPVEGQVFYKDQPLPNGTVVFQPADGPPSVGKTTDDGTFKMEPNDRMKGARIGLNKVRISARVQPSNGESEVALGRLITPERYATFESSGLTAEVKPDGNEPFVFRLTD